MQKSVHLKSSLFRCSPAVPSVQMVVSHLQGLPSVVYMGCSQPEGGLRGGGAKARLLMSGAVYGLREE